MKTNRARQHRNQIKDHCTRWTVPREEIFDLLIRSQQHLSAKEIYATLSPANPEIGLTTVYRTLDLLANAGLARKINTGDGQVRFEYIRGDHSDHHHHLICTGCGTILNYRDFEKEELDLVRKTEEILAAKHKFLIREHNIEFFGLCEDCRPGGRKSPIK
ncbi:MAG: Fur family transcriptional regulator [Candidatus Aminicenantales bacterium]